jgi:hypothetical protein
MDELAESTKVTGECNIQAEASPAGVYKIPQNAERRYTFFGSDSDEITARRGLQVCSDCPDTIHLWQGMQYRYSGS